MLKWNYKGTSSKEARYKRSHFVWLHLCEMSWESIEKESRLVVAGGGGWTGKWGVTDEWIWGFFRGDEKFVKLNSGNGCTTVKILKITELYTLKGSILWYVNYISVTLFLKKKRGRRKWKSPETEESRGGSDPSNEVRYSGAGSGRVFFGSRCFIPRKGAKEITSLGSDYSITQPLPRTYGLCMPWTIILNLIDGFQ